MSNATSAFDFDQSLAVLLAVVVSDGTNASILQDLKVDAIAAPASVIVSDAGQLWANRVDDYFLATYPHFEGRPTGTDALIRGELPAGSATLIATIAPAADTTIHYKARAYAGAAVNVADRYVQHLELLVQNIAGAVTVTTIDSSETRAGLYASAPGNMITGHVLFGGTEYRLIWEAGADASIDLHVDIHKIIRSAAI